MKKVLLLIGKILLGILIAAVTLVILVLAGLNIAKYFLYAEYYSMESNLCTNPGLGDGFVCQGVAVSEGETAADTRILVSGYMKDDRPSRIYITDLDSNSYYVSLTKENGDDFTGHAGGIAVTGETVYLANGGHIYLIPLADLLSAEKGDVVTLGQRVKVNNSASYVFTDEEYLYVGEFHDGGKYVTDHPYDTPDGKYHAIISRYPLANFADHAAPDKIYSVRNKVQGAAFTPDGKVFLSTSYGLTDSVYYIYNEADAVDSGLTLDGAPVYYLNGCVKEFNGPAMGEDTDYFNGRIVTLTESASNKYIFGKFFFANKIVALDID